MRSGIYRIVNVVNQRTYLGSSVDMHRRIRVHRRDLRVGIHSNRFLQSSWNKYGALAFEFEQLIECAECELPIREQAFLDAYREHDLNLYNLKPSADSRTGQRYIATPEARAKISAGTKGNKGNTGKTFTPEHCAKIGMANKRRIFTPEMLANMSAAQIGRPGTPHSQAHRAYMRMVMKGKRNALGCSRSQEVRARMSAAQLKRYRERKAPEMER